MALVGGVPTFTPAPNFFGTARFEYTASDGVATDVGAVAIAVTSVNDDGTWNDIHCDNWTAIVCKSQ